MGRRDRDLPRALARGGRRVRLPAQAPPRPRLGLRRLRRPARRQRHRWRPGRPLAVVRAVRRLPTRCEPRDPSHRMAHAPSCSVPIPPPRSLHTAEIHASGVHTWWCPRRPPGVPRRQMGAALCRRTDGDVVHADRGGFTCLCMRNHVHVHACPYAYVCVPWSMRMHVHAMCMRCGCGCA